MMILSIGSADYSISYRYRLQPIVLRMAVISTQLYLDLTSALSFRLSLV